MRRIDELKDRSVRLIHLLLIQHQQQNGLLHCSTIFEIVCDKIFRYPPKVAGWVNMIKRGPTGPRITFLGKVFIRKIQKLSLLDEEIYFADS